MTTHKLEFSEAWNFLSSFKKSLKSAFNWFTLKLFDNITSTSKVILLCKTGEGNVVEWQVGKDIETGRHGSLAGAVVNSLDSYHGSGVYIGLSNKSTDQMQQLLKFIT